MRNRLEQREREKKSKFETRTEVEGRIDIDQINREIDQKEMEIVETVWVVRFPNRVLENQVRKVPGNNQRSCTLIRVLSDAFHHVFSFFRFVFFLSLSLLHVNVWLMNRCNYAGTNLTPRTGKVGL